VKNKKVLTIFIIAATFILAATAIFIGLRLRSNVPTTPGETEASPAACCSVPGSGGACDGGATSCQGGDPTSACAAGSWCWCATVSNQCPQDPNHSSEIMCGSSAYDGGGVTYTCPDGSQATSNVGVTDCGRCGTDITPIEVCPGLTLEVTTDSGKTAVSGQTLTITKGDNLSVKVKSTGKYYVLKVMNWNGQTGKVCSEPKNFAGVVNSQCPTYPSGLNVDTSDNFWDKQFVVRLEGYTSGGEVIDNCREDVKVNYATETPTPTPTNTPTPTPTGTITPTPTPVANMSLDKTAASVCNADSTISTITYTITVVNNGATLMEGIELFDKVDSKIINYIDQASITDGGTMDPTSGLISWRGLSIAAGQTKLITYKANVPSSLFGQELTNTVTMDQLTGPNPGENTPLGEKTMKITASCKVLPKTALISDSADRVMIGLLLIIVGVLAFRLDLQEKVWLLFKKAGGKYLVANFDENERKKLTDKKKDKFEKNIKKRLD
jgi:hypothetical protein